MKRRGFTLIEMMVALAIFAVIGVISAQLINRIVDHQVVLSERSARLIEVQRAMHFMKRDVMQYVDRSVRDEFGGGQQHPALELDTSGILTFTRTGWRNPLGQPRSNLQRLAYTFEDDELKRYYWRVLDRVADSEPLEQTLLSDVRDAEFQVIDQNGNAHSFWGTTNPPGVEARAILLRIEMAPYGVFERIWTLP